MPKNRCAKIWQPIFTTRTGLPFTISISIVFLILSFFLLIAPSPPYEVEIDYTDCKSIEPPFDDCSERSKSGKSCSCLVSFDIGQRSITLLHIYVKLGKAHQNHRLYAESHDLNQEIGEPLPETAADSCAPLQYIDNKTIAPCGTIPNSLFNDTIKITHEGKDIPIKTSNIINFSERRKFKNPPSDPLSSAFVDFQTPPDWVIPMYKLDENNPKNNGFLNVRYISWLRIFPFSDVLKQLGSIPENSSPLDHGKYSILINYHYNVKSYDGKKILILSQATWLGRPKNKIGYVYCSGLILGIIVSTLFGLINRYYQRDFNSII